MNGDFYGDTADQQIMHSMEEHEMTETHRAFRERITQTGWDAVDGTDDGSTMPLVCLAVYREALRDVLASMTPLHMLNSWGGAAELKCFTEDDLRSFAADKGITLEDGDDLTADDVHHAMTDALGDGYRRAMGEDDHE